MLDSFPPFPDLKIRYPKCAFANNPLYSLSSLRVSLHLRTQYLGALLLSDMRKLLVTALFSISTDINLRGSNILALKRSSNDAAREEKVDLKSNF